MLICRFRRVGLTVYVVCNKAYPGLGTVSKNIEPEPSVEYLIKDTTHMAYTNLFHLME